MKSALVVYGKWFVLDKYATGKISDNALTNMANIGWCNVR